MDEPNIASTNCTEEVTVIDCTSDIANLTAALMGGFSSSCVVDFVCDAGCGREWTADDTVVKVRADKVSSEQFTQDFTSVVKPIQCPECETVMKSETVQIGKQ